MKALNGAVPRSRQRWRLNARVHDLRRKRGIVDRWTERAGVCWQVHEWEVRAARAGVELVADMRRLDAAIERAAGKRKAKWRAA